MNLKQVSLLKARTEFLRASLRLIPGGVTEDSHKAAQMIRELSAGRMTLDGYERSLRSWCAAVQTSAEDRLKPVPADLAGRELYLAAVEMAAKAASLVTEWQFNQATFALEGFGAKKFLAAKANQPR